MAVALKEFNPFMRRAVMKKYRLAVTHLLLSVGIAFALSAPAQSQQPETVIPLEGLDPVLLSQGKEVMGNMKITVTRGRYQYVFANEESKTLFEKSPERYEIQLDGSCARMGPSVGGNADLYSVYQGRIYIFGSGNCKKVFDTAPEKYLEPIISREFTATPEAVKRGQMLIEKAVAAMGGAARIDAITSFQEAGLSTTIQQQNTVEYKTSLIRAFPDSIRSEEVRTFGTVTEVVSATDSFSIFKNDRRAMTNSMRTVAAAEFRKQARLAPLEILRARKNADFKVAFIGQENVADLAVEQVVLQIAEGGLRLGIEAASGRVLSLTYRGRSRGTGEVGEVKKIYSDFRLVAGLTVPFKTIGTFNGQPDPEQTHNVETISFNIKIEPATFERPKQTGAQ
jgi:YHS domain-containing protein